MEDRGWGPGSPTDGVLAALRKMATVVRKAGVSVQCHSGDQERVKKKEEQWNTVHMIAHKRSLHTQILTRSNGMNFKLQREFQTSNMHELTRHKSKIKKILKKKRKRKYDCRPYKYKTSMFRKTSPFTI